MATLEQELKQRARGHRLRVELHVVGLQRPTHMEWTPDGRLLVSEHRAGAVKDITHGGEATEIATYASGLRGPAALLPIEDRILVTEMLGGRVTDISQGGDVTNREPFASGLRLPYNIVGAPNGDETRIVVSEDASLGILQYTDITNGGSRSDFVPFITTIPARSHYQMKPTIDFDELTTDTPTGEFDFFMPPKCGSWGIVYAIEDSSDLVVAASSLGLIARVPQDGGDFMSLVADHDRVLAWGLDLMGGMKEHPTDGMIYVSQPHRGCVLAVDPSEPHNYVFDAPVLELPRPGFPSCIRFSPEGDTMFICDAGHGVVWKVEGFER